MHQLTQNVCACIEKRIEWTLERKTDGTNRLIECESLYNCNKRHIQACVGSLVTPMHLFLLNEKHIRTWSCLSLKKMKETSYIVTYLFLSRSGWLFRQPGKVASNFVEWKWKITIFQIMSSGVNTERWVCSVMYTMSRSQNLLLVDNCSTADKFFRFYIDYGNRRWIFVEPGFFTAMNFRLVE